MDAQDGRAVEVDLRAVRIEDLGHVRRWLAKRERDSVAPGALKPDEARDQRARTSRA
jgi:hypothetical protein